MTGIGGPSERTHLNYISPYHLVMPFLALPPALGTQEPMLDLLVGFKDLRDIEAIEVPPQEFADMRNIGFNHFSETWYAWLRRNGVLFNKASNCHGPGKGGETNVHEFRRI